MWNDTLVWSRNIGVYPKQDVKTISTKSLRHGNKDFKTHPLMPCGNVYPLNNFIYLYLSIYQDVCPKAQGPVRLCCLTEWPAKIVVSVNYPENIADLVCYEAMG